MAENKWTVVRITNPRNRKRWSYFYKQSGDIERNVFFPVAPPAIYFRRDQQRDTEAPKTARRPSQVPFRFGNRLNADLERRKRGDAKWVGERKLPELPQITRPTLSTSSIYSASQPGSPSPGAPNLPNSLRNMVTFADSLCVSKQKLRTGIQFNQVVTSTSTTSTFRATPVRPTGKPKLHPISRDRNTGRSTRVPLNIAEFGGKGPPSGSWSVNSHGVPSFQPIQDAEEAPKAQIINEEMCMPILRPIPHVPFFAENFEERQRKAKLQLSKRCSRAVWYSRRTTSILRINNTDVGDMREAKPTKSQYAESPSRKAPNDNSLGYVRSGHTRTDVLALTNQLFQSMLITFPDSTEEIYEPRGIVRPNCLTAKDMKSPIIAQKEVQDLAQRLPND